VTAAMAKNPSLVEINNADVYLAGHKVLSSIDWTMKANENWAVVGNNGAGKTTFMKLIFGEVIPVYGGGVRLFGARRLTPIWEIREKIGFVSAEFQASYEFNICGLQVVLSGLFSSIGLHREVTEKQRERAHKLMEQLDIGHLANSPFRQLSYGETRRIILARALINRPALLILDEPCAGLDIPTREHFLKTLEKLSAGRTRMIYVTHRIEEILPCITQVLYLKKGRVFAQGDKAAMLKEKVLSRALGCKLRLQESDGRYWIAGAGSSSSKKKTPAR